MSAVKIKGIGGKQGLVFIIDLNKEIDEINKALLSLLKETSGFFSKNTINLSFIESHQDGDFEKMRQVQRLILDQGFLMSGNIDVVENTVVEEKSKTRIVRKSLRAGVKFTFDGTLVVFGDVNPGAYIEVTGSFICIGSVYGVVHAGQKLYEEKNTDEEICVFAMKIDSPQIKVKNEMIQNIRGSNWLHVVE